MRPASALAAGVGARERRQHPTAVLPHHFQRRAGLGAQWQLGASPPIQEAAGQEAAARPGASVQPEAEDERCRHESRHQRCRRPPPAAGSQAADQGRPGRYGWVAGHWGGVPWTLKCWLVGGGEWAMPLGCLWRCRGAWEGDRERWRAPGRDVERQQRCRLRSTTCGRSTHSFLAQEQCRLLCCGLNLPIRTRVRQRDIMRDFRRLRSLPLVTPEGRPCHSASPPLPHRLMSLYERMRVLDAVQVQLCALWGPVGGCVVRCVRGSWFFGAMQTT